MTLVGDLATTPGTNVNGNCRVWEYTIKDGVKFEDGQPITSKEIAEGIARSFDPDLTSGPTYAECDRILALDPAQQTSQWAAVDKQIMTELAPAVPLYVDVADNIHGSKAGGLFISGIFGSPAFVNAYVKQ